MITITIDRGLEQPVYEQVAGQLRQLIGTGRLAPGTTLPPVRRLAGDLGVNLNTVARAYRLLEEEGFLVIRGRAGVRVAAPAEAVEDSVREGLLKELRVILARFRQAGVAPKEMLSMVRTELHVPDGTSLEDTDD